VYKATDTRQEYLDSAPVQPPRNRARLLDLATQRVEALMPHTRRPSCTGT
jgi:hypothetical protein